MILRKRLFIRDGDSVAVRVETTIRELVKQAVEELREVLLVDDADQVRRLYPTAYPDDAEAQERFSELVHDHLLMQRLDDIDTVVGSIDAESIDLDTADAWMSTINQVRLVLGTRLDVGEDDDPIDPDDPDAQPRMLYQLFSYLLDELTDARTSFL